jgi:hypothetical protein
VRERLTGGRGAGAGAALRAIRTRLGL